MNENNLTMKEKLELGVAFHGGENIKIADLICLETPALDRENCFSVINPRVRFLERENNFWGNALPLRLKDRDPLVFWCKTERGRY